MNKKIIFIVIAILLGIGIIILLIVRSQSSQKNPAPPQAQTVDEARANAFQNTLKDAQGNPWVQDKTGVREHILAQEHDYSINYFEKYDMFLIGILNHPFEEKRKEAEQRFLRIINAPPAVACKLNVKVYVSFDVSHALAGKNFPLSFCK